VYNFLVIPIDLTLRTHYEILQRVSRTFGDRNKDDKAMIGGLGQIDGQSFMIVGQKRNQY
jgi:acetyl-CoA carboxylase alpha subunit